MADQQKTQKEINVVKEPAEDFSVSTESLKASILTLVEQTKDKKLLSLVWSMLQKKESPEKLIQLSKHAEDIFASYPETMQKLAQ